MQRQGGLGPLQSEAAIGTLTWTLGGGTKITRSHVVGGLYPDGAKPLAPLTDKVLAEHLSRLRKRLDTPAN